MTSGAYLLSGHDGPYALERFSCGRTGTGWRYDAVREHPATAARLGRLELERDGSTTRLHVEAGGWVLRGAASGGEAFWRRGDEERAAAADGFTGSSPGFLVALAQAGRLQLVEVTEPVLATRVTVQQWAARPPEEHDDVRLAVWEVDEPATGQRQTVRLAGDVVVQAPGVRLIALTRS